MLTDLVLSYTAEVSYTQCVGSHICLVTHSRASLLSEGKSEKVKVMNR